MELDPVSLQSKADKAERAIRERLCDPDPTLHERIALHNTWRELQLLVPQNSKRQKSGEMKNLRAGFLPQTRASAAQSRVVEQLSNGVTAKVLPISSGAVKARTFRAQRELKDRTRSRRSAR